MLSHTLKRILARLPFAETAARWLSRPGAPVFMLHRVLPHGEPCYDPEMATCSPLFEAFLQWITAHYDVIHVPELLRRVAEPGRRRRPFCALTFDDGWRDNYLHAFPLLRRYQIPATIFLITGLMGSDRRLWQERLWAISQRSTLLDDRRVLLEEVVPSLPWCPRLSAEQLNFSSLRRFLLNHSSPEAEQFVSRWEEAIDQPAMTGAPAFLSWDEVREMHRAGVAFGSHTVNHTLLTRASPRQAQQEIRASQKDLEDRLGRVPLGFAYPWGSTTDRVTLQVKEAGYDFAVTTRQGFVRPQACPWRLPRIAISGPVLSGSKDRFDSASTSLYIAAGGLKGRLHR